MPSNLYKSVGQSQLQPQFSNMQNIIAQFNNFRQTFKGDPKQQVQQLLNSGKMSQAQFNQLQQAAVQFQNMLK